MFPHLWKSCVALQIIISAHRQVTCDPCTLSELEKHNGLCTGQIHCLHKLDFDYKTWNCINTTSTSSVYNPKTRSYWYPPFYNETFNLVIRVKDAWANISLTTYKKQCTQLVLEGGESTSVPKDILEMTNLEELNITGNNISAINLPTFCSMPSLKKIVLQRNAIRVIEIDDKFNDTAIKHSDSVESIDLSNNYIEILPDYFVLRFNKLKHLNLSHNLINNIGVLTFEAVLTLQAIDLSHNRLRELGQALARFSDVTTLNISHNNITGLFPHNFAKLSNLEILNPSFNDISVIETNTFQNLTKLKDLDLSNNNLKIIHRNVFDNNVNLQALILSNNNIELVEKKCFDKMQLKKFSIQNNSLTGPLQDNTFKGVNVLELNLSGGKLSRIDNGAFNGMSELTNLNLSSNSISKLSFSAFSNLELLSILDLSYNRLEDFNVDSQKLTLLTKLFVSNNKIEKIHKKVFENFVSLTELDLSFNNIKVIEPYSFWKLNNVTIFLITNNKFVSDLETEVLEGLTSLEKLDLFKTSTTVFRNSTFYGMSALINVNYTFGLLQNIEYNAFIGISLEKLILSNNHLQEFYVNTSTISQVEELYLDHNLIRNISDDALSQLALLRVLNLANNKIITLNSDVFQDLNALTHIDLSSNERMSIVGNPFHNLKKLYSVTINNVKGDLFSISSFANSSASIEILNLRSCDIDDVNNVGVFNVQRLSYLNLSMNKLNTIDVNSFKNVTTLLSVDLSLNKIDYVQPGSFLNVKNLQSLDLSGNNIATIQFGVFDGIENLRYLNLSNNIISNFDVKLLPHTENLFLDGNAISYFDFEGFLNINLTELSLGGNELSCKVLAELKVSNNSEKFKRIVTANPFNFHSENVDGISCQSTSNINPNHHDINSTDPSTNIGSSVLTLKNILDKMSQSVQVVGKISNTIKDIHKTAKSLDISNNMIQNTVSNRLSDLTATNDNSNLQLVFIKQYLQQLLGNKTNDESDVSKLNSQNLQSEFQNLKQEMKALRKDLKEASISKSLSPQKPLNVPENKNPGADNHEEDVHE